MKEIGGYFELEQLINNPYHKNVVELNTARNALIYLIKAKKIKKLYIPFFLCDSVTEKLEKHAIEYEYYHINRNFLPIFKKELKKDEFLYIVNYYGQVGEDKIIFLKNKYLNVIIDNTQAFFQRPVSGIDAIYSCRKFFGVPDGAYLATDTILEEKLPVDISKNRMGHILGRYEGQATDYYKNFKENDESFRELPLMLMSRLTKNILGAIDYENARITRVNNFKYLHNRLFTKNMLDIIIPDGPFAYPLYVNNGVEIRKELASKKIYVPTFWPNVIRNEIKDSVEYDYAANILPLPCDQRYNEEDMDYLVKEVLNCLTK